MSNYDDYLNADRHDPALQGDFEALCNTLPAGICWGDPVTPDMVAEIRDAAQLEMFGVLWQQMKAIAPTLPVIDQNTMLDIIPAFYDAVTPVILDRARNA